MAAYYDSGHVDALRCLREVGGKELLMLGADQGEVALTAAIGRNKDVCILLARLRMLEDGPPSTSLCSAATMHSQA